MTYALFLARRVIAVVLATGIFSGIGICGAETAPPTEKTTAKAADGKPAKAVKKGRSEKDASTPKEAGLDRHAKFMEQAKKGMCDLLFLGDSITDHWPRWSKESWAQFAKYKPLNFGIGGQHTEHILWRIRNGELEGIHPKVVVLLLGTNNIGHTPDKPEWVAAGLKEIINTVQEKQPQAKVLLLAIFPRGGKDSAFRKRINATNALLGTYDNGTSVRYLDIGNKLVDANGEIPKDIMGDGLHPGDKGYKIWAAAMLPLLDEMMNGKAK